MTHRTKTTHFKVAWNGSAKWNSPSFLLLCFYDLQSYGYGAQNLLPGHSFSQADWHPISQHAKARARWAFLLKLLHSGCHFLLCHSVLLRKKVVFPPETENFLQKLKNFPQKLKCQMQGHMGLTESRRAAVLVPLQRLCLFLWLLHRHTEKCLLPKVLEGGETPRVSLNTLLKCWLQSRRHEAFFLHSSSIFGLLCIYFIFYFYCFSLHYEGWGTGAWPQTGKEK